MDPSTQQLSSEAKRLLDDYLIRRAILENILDSIRQKPNVTPLDRQINQHNTNEIQRRIEELEDRVCVEMLRLQNAQQ